MAHKAWTPAFAGVTSSGGNSLRAYVGVTSLPNLLLSLAAFYQVTGQLDCWPASQSQSATLARFGETAFVPTPNSSATILTSSSDFLLAD